VRKIVKRKIVKRKIAKTRVEENAALPRRTIR
jgi:hypothetical protein